MATLALLGVCKAHATSTVTVDHARFEFLTPTLVRLEYSPTGHFINAPTVVVEKRDWPNVGLHQQMEHGWLIVSTDAMTLRYRVQSGAFNATNLEVKWRDAGATRTWRPGQVDRGNLGGLTYSLDNVSSRTLPAGGHDLESPVGDIIPGIDVLLPEAEPGLLSRSGFAFIDDSRSPTWNARAQWIEARQGGGQDWYLFTYGHDYRKVLAEYAQLCGGIPMIPRYALEPMITDLNFPVFPGSPPTRTSAFRNYGTQHLEDEVMRFRKNHIPLGVLVLDFGWHDFGWQGGYDWSPLISHPTELLKWLHTHGIKLALNDHPGYADTRESILSHRDSHATEVLKALGRPLPPKPSFNLDLSRGWRFAPDPHDEGVRDSWFAPGYDDAEWRAIRTDESPARQGYKNITSVVWYRTRARLPVQLPDKLYLDVSEQSKGYRLYVDGREVEHSHVHWPRRLTWADITPWAKAGKTLSIALRLEPDEYGSGFLDGLVAIRNVKPPAAIRFDLADKKQARVFMRELHDPLLRQGVSFWWVDGGNGAANMPGLNAQLWTNRLFYDYTQRVTRKRGFILSRYGGWGSERYPAYFTGDTYSQWPVLAYEVAYSVRGGNVLVPYISDDIGGFHGGKIPFDLYARWVEFGALSPLLRMHSAHENPREGNLRMPWTYGQRGIALVRKYFTLHAELIPYVYTFAWIAHTQSVPIMRPLYLQNPDSSAAYQHPHEYWYGTEMLVAPVLDASGERTVYLPPGPWIGFFDGKRYEGNRSVTSRYAADEMPVFVRDGAIIPERPAASARLNAQPRQRLVINVYGSGDGEFDLYDDDGESLAYRRREFALTPMRYTRLPDGSHLIVIGPTRGTFNGQLQRRSYDVQFHGIGRPASILVNGVKTNGWTWDAATGTATVTLPAQSIRDRVTVDWRAANVN